MMSAREIKPPDGSIDAGLSLLLAVTPRGHTRTAEEIAFVCGCSMQNIQQIEYRAMSKLRQAFASRRFVLEVLHELEIDRPSFQTLRVSG